MDRIVRKYLSLGWTVVIDDENAEVELRKVLPAGASDPDDLSPLLKNKLIDLDLGGVLRIRSVPGEGAAHKRVTSATIVLPSLELVVPVAPKAPVAPEAPEHRAR